MARYRETIEVARPQRPTFDYLADFSTTAEWDPGITEAQRLDDAPVGRGSRFRVVADFMGRGVELTYEITAYEPPHRVVLEGSNRFVRSEDEITFEARGEDATAVTYDARLTGKGPFKLLDPVVSVSFQRTGDKAVEGMKQTLGTPLR